MNYFLYKVASSSLLKYIIIQLYINFKATLFLNYYVYKNKPSIFHSIYFKL